MSKIYAGALILLLSANSYCAEWGQERSSAMGRTVDLETPHTKLSLTWPEKIIPGEDILMVSSTDFETKDKYFYRYKFSGIYANSAKINITGAHQNKENGSAYESESMKQTIFLEHASDGAFYLIPKEIKNDGVIIIKRDESNLGMYTLKIIRN